ncbi:hypothetical protein [Prauserella flavalba]|uniref:hypothetical protein n=1 Tax=Prauserella flavalba TaxID=1477506 RepID=UPI0036F10223
MNGYGVDPRSLVAAGQRFVELADDAGEATAEFLGGVEPHAGANQGFATTGKARALASLWESQLDDLGKRTAMAGGLLRESADGYERMEDAVVESLPPLNSAS